MCPFFERFARHHDEPAGCDAGKGLYICLFELCPEPTKKLRMIVVVWLGINSNSRCAAAALVSNGMSMRKAEWQFWSGADGQKRPRASPRPSPRTRCSGIG